MWITLPEYLKKINEDSKKYFSINENILEVNEEIIPIDFNKIFDNNDKLLKFEIGFGNCESLIKLALKYPEINYFGIDRKMDRIRTALSKLNKRKKIHNLTIARLGTDYLGKIINPSTFDEIIMNFPDPWPKKKHHKNRTLCTEFLIVLNNMLKKDGYFRFSSDHEEYSMEVLSLFENSELFRNAYDCSLKNEINDRIETQFERHKKREGFKIYHLKFQKI
ncbi:MAG: hypothetical protein KKD38_04940 [Candidatus Delongbacteria bacterium]|nr:hypothetical protein [Candidatus Delongbacteria bacterium]MCG2761512.1 hypothetical protein [Candidatus Delongbacteria bacterium]